MVHISGFAGAAAQSQARDQACESVKQMPQRPTVSAFVEVRADRCFADALMAAMDGQRIMRRGWNGPGQHVSAQYPDLNSKMSRPYLYLKATDGGLIPWVPSQGDLFAHDWAILPT